jgi:hypothetical protein
MADSFVIDIEKWAKKTTKNLVDVNRAALVELNSRIIMGTPVDTGFHRGGWTASVNTMPLGYAHGFDSTGVGTTSKVNNIARGAIGSVYYLYNNLPAIRVIEYGEFTTKSETEKTKGGFSKQAPKGMVRLAFKELNREINSVKTK